MLKRVFQTIIDPERGDCERACVATITGIDIGEIPNFSETGTDHRLWMREWLNRYGWCIVEPKRHTTPTDYTWAGLLGIAAIATVPSQAFPGGKHAVVVGWRPDPRYPEAALEPYIIHDPNPNNAPYGDVCGIIERLRWLVPRAE